MDVGRSKVGEGGDRADRGRSGGAEVVGRA